MLMLAPDSKGVNVENEIYRKWKTPHSVFMRLWADMREVNGFFLFELGQIALLAAFPPDIDLTPSLAVLVNNRTNLDNFAKAEENKQDLSNSVDDAIDLVKKIDLVIARKPAPSISKQELNDLGYRLLTFRDRLSAELGRVYSYVLEEKGGRSVKTLWRKALTLISPNVLPHLSDFTTDNFEEAGKCWVVDRPTAVGFHMMRSVERVLREYKKLVTGQGFSFTDKRGTTQYQGFGTLLNDLNARLEDLKKNKAPFGKLELVIGILRPLSKLYRDPLSHPELKKLEEEDAKLTFEQGMAAISTIVQDALDGGVHFTTGWLGRNSSERGAGPLGLC